MNTKGTGKGRFAIALCLAMAPPWAWSNAEHSAEALFSAAVAAFRAGHFQQARNQFLAAARAGKQGGRIYYNLGVVDYKLGYYPSSYEYFKQAITYPGLEALSAYNLGLVALKLDNPEEAEGWFATAREASDDPALQRLASGGLSAAHEWPAQPRPDYESPPDSVRSLYSDHLTGKRSWRGVLRNELGFDDNVMLYRDSSASQATSTSDPFITVQGALQGRVAPGVNVELSLQQLDYLNKNDYDYARLGMEIKQVQRLSRWTIEIGGLLDRLFLDNSPFQQIGGLSVEGERPVMARLLGSFRYSVEFISDLNADYSHLAGRRDRFETKLRLGEAPRYASLYYHFEFNDRDDFYFDNRLYASYSPVRHTVGALFARDMGRVSVESFADYTFSAYRDKDVLDNGRAVGRRDELFRAGLRMALPVGKRLKLEANYYHANNRSIFTRNYYRNNRYRMGMRWDI